MASDYGVPTAYPEGESMSINKERQARVQKAIKKGQWKMNTPLGMSPTVAKAYAEKKANLEPHNKHEASHEDQDAR
jgi:hypothetical protein